MRASIILVVLVASASAPVPGATLPPHAPLRILVVSDEVNPHGLPPAQLTQPGEISAALAAPGNGLNLDPAPDAVVEIPTNSIEQATALLARPPDDPAAYDVLVYFAHRIPNNGNNAAGRQAAFTAAVDQFLEDGGGVVSFHHGAYLTAGKEAILDLIGGTAAGTVVWNTVEGQNVIAVTPRHFVACNGVGYPGSVAYADPTRGVPLDDYPFFNNTPDERYLSFNLNPTAGEVTVLFGSNYVQNGSTHLLGFVHERPAWSGRVVAYQPGEYQPNALDPEGSNFQVLANAILYARGAVPEDGIRLTVARGPGASDVTLEWSACPGGSFSVFRSADPATVDEPASQLGSTSAMTWIDSPPPGGIVYYRVVR